MDRDKQLEAYDRFRAYVHREMRDKNNRLTVVDYSKIPRPGPTHLRIELENCFSADSSLFELVKQYHPEASLVVKENLLSKGSRYIANVPWCDEPKQRRSRRHSDADAPPRIGEPNLNVPMLWGMALMATVVAATLTTEFAQWQALMGV